MDGLAALVAAIGAVLSGLSGYTAYLTWRRNAKQDEANEDVSFIKASQEALLSTIERLHAEIESSDRRHQLDLERLNAKLTVMQKNHAECEDERLALLRRVRTLEERRR